MKTLIACIFTTIVYFVTLVLSAWLFSVITHQPVDLARDPSGIVLGICLLTVPYAVNGLMCRKIFANSLKAAVITSLILVICERLFIYLVGLYFVMHGGDGPMDARPVMLFIQAEAAPYFTLPYILMGFVSVGISAMSARIPGQRRHL